MTDNLSEVLAKIGEEYREKINNDSRHCIEISIAKKAAELGFSEAQEQYKNAFAIVLLKDPFGGMKVRSDGRTFVNYAQFEFGIVVPNYIARQVDLPQRPYTAQDSMRINRCHIKRFEKIHSGKLQRTFNDDCVRQFLQHPMNLVPKEIRSQHQP